MNVLIRVICVNPRLVSETNTSHPCVSHRTESTLLENDGIDFYDEVERYEIELIRTALNQCGGNQTQAAKLLRLKSTTLNAKMKHYGLNPVRSIMLQRQNASQTT